MFNPYLYVILGFSKQIVNYLLMCLVSLTVMICFDVLESIMVIPCVIGPSVTSLLLTKTLFKGFLLSLWIAIANSNLRYFLGILWNLPVAILMILLI
ncbi:metal ABC transporter permease [Candidatus Phytoplasma melaleucae]|uniref:Metal ABC transporter permease n=1 Tax=Candidatus Phytoplasma melaleucae TaxID=2982630 RepID=A0ABT9DE79_9MOLU|nr:metal ABC transporter permease ['Melaleuca sp.' phytoplasma]MDO8167977.1 metal ABC transporter permease ['Melaleuca sp.' phytoplasma]